MPLSANLALGAAGEHQAAQQAVVPRPHARPAQQREALRALRAVLVAALLTVLNHAAGVEERIAITGTEPRIRALADKAGSLVALHAEPFQREADILSEEVAGAAGLAGGGVRVRQAVGD